MKRTIVILCCAVSLMLASAFSGKKHWQLGYRAAEAYYYLTKDSLTYEHKTAFADGCEFEDLPRRLLKKGRNQHFFPHGKHLDDKRVFTRRTATLIEEIKAMAAKGKKNKKYWKKVGMLTHYIQDMACPPHVIPIYHLEYDSFDNVCFINYGLPAITMTKEQMMEKAKKEYVQLLNDLSSSTLDAVRGKLSLKKNKKDTVMTWEVFWKIDSTNQRIRNFGYYGEAGNNFGKADICFSCRDDDRSRAWMPFRKDSHFMCPDKSDTYEIAGPTYVPFVEARLRQALESSMVIIAWAKKL